MTTTGANTMTATTRALTDIYKPRAAYEVCFDPVPGDRFRYNDGVQEEVLSVDGDNIRVLLNSPDGIAGTGSEISDGTRASWSAKSSRPGRWIPAPEEPKPLDPSEIHALIGSHDAVDAFVKQLTLPTGVLSRWPEIGVHPYDIPGLVAKLRRDTPCLILTFCPLIINELEGHEVSVVTFDADGQPVVTLLNQTRHYVDRRKVYENGELWLAHPDIEGREE